ncbi:MAG: 50S ribosomal protein L10 [Anaerolineales bacterium]|nr:50S ribosomal protein L10 [Anaerolineales bacterium]
MAISKKQKEELVEQYKQWVAKSDGMVVTHYHGLSVTAISNLRRDIRETGGEFHIIKNTLAKRAFEESGREWKEGVFNGPTALGISYENATGLAKVIKDFSKEFGTVEIKSGYLAERLMSVEEIVAMAELPSMAEMRAKLLSTILAPASKLVRTLAEPGRQVAAVLKSYSETEPAA